MDSTGLGSMTDTFVDFIKIGQKKDFIVSFSAKQNRRATRQNTQITLLFDGCEYDGGSDPG